MDRLIDWLFSDKFVTIFTAFCSMIAAVRVYFSRREHVKSMKLINENTDISTQAFAEANGVNLKLMKSNKSVDELALQVEQLALQIKRLLAAQVRETGE